MTADLFDPSGGSSIAAAAGWIASTLTGTVASVIAIVAVAAFGVAMMTGRIELRRGISVVLGCFIVFGAREIAAGLMGLSAYSSGLAGSPTPPMSRSQPIPLPPTAPPTYDPYAGASVPPR